MCLALHQAFAQLRSIFFLLIVSSIQYNCAVSFLFDNNLNLTIERMRCYSQSSETPSSFSTRCSPANYTYFSKNILRGSSGSYHSVERLESFLYALGQSMMPRRCKLSSLIFFESFAPTAPFLFPRQSSSGPCNVLSFLHAKYHDRRSNEIEKEEKERGDGEKRSRNLRRYRRNEGQNGRRTER